MKKILFVSAFVIGAVAVRADDSTMSGQSTESSPFQASLTPDIAVHPRSTEIDGFAINVWGENPQHSLNLGIVNGSTDDSSGFSVGIFNCSDSYTGAQWGIVNYSKEDFKGWQEGWVNISQGTFTGWQDGYVNISKNVFTGLQSGWVNVSEEFHGLQLGIVNYAEELHGVQIGVANIAVNNGWFDNMPNQFAKGFPLFNWSF